MPKRTVLSGMVVLFSLVFASVAAAQQSVEFRDLGTPPGTAGSEATAINNRGHVVGDAGLIVGDITVNVPFVWTPQGGFNLFLGETRGGASDINDRGEVVGAFGSGDELHGYLWSPQSGVVDLGANFQPAAINNRGQVAGECVISGVTRACLWDQGVLVPLEVPRYVSFVTDINARGQVIGYSCSDTCTGWIWTPRKGAVAFAVFPEGLNNRGQVVGRHLSPSIDGVVVSADGRVVRRSPSGYAWYAINSRGWAVGAGVPPSEPGEFPTLWYPNGTIVTLPSPGDAYAIDVNERGQITGTALQGGWATAVVWTVRGSAKE